MDPHLLGATEQSLDLIERPRWHQHLLTRSHQGTLRQVTDREPVGVGRRELHSIIVSRDKHAGEHDSTLIRTGGPNDLTERVRHVSRGHRERFGRRLPERRVVSQGERTD